jgi:hypothetical protein
VSPETVAETIGGVELGGGCGRGHDSDAVPESVQVAGEGCEAVGVVPPQAQRTIRDKSRVSRCNFQFNGRAGQTMLGPCDSLNIPGRTGQL